MKCLVCDEALPFVREPGNNVICRVCVRSMLNMVRPETRADLMNLADQTEPRRN
jgi:hypothetical protein